MSERIITFEIRTRRTTLQPVRPDDVPELHRHWTDPGVRRFLWDDVVIPEAQVVEVVQTSEELFAERGVGLWCVRSAADAAFLGCAGYFYFHEPPRLELVISLSPKRWGQGLAQEIGSALIEYALDERGWASVEASTDAPNAPSLRLMERLGMRPYGRAPGPFGSTEMYRLTREGRPKG